MISKKAREDTVMRGSNKSVRESGRSKITKDVKEKESTESDKEAVSRRDGMR